MPNDGCEDAGACRGAGISAAVEALRRGELIVYPTDTFYAIGADPFSAIALDRLFDLKRRDPEKPVALIASDAAMAFALAREVPAAEELARRFWPGPLTIVMDARESLPPLLRGSRRTIGVRVPAHPSARELAARLARPITATSANLTGAPPARTTAECRSTFGSKVKVFVEGGRLNAAMPSTVVRVADDSLEVLRRGEIEETELRAVLSRSKP